MRLISSLWQPAHVTHPRVGPIVLVRDDVDTSICASLDRSAFRVGTVEPGDLPACVDVLMCGFYKDILTLARAEFTDEEMALMTPTLSVFNGAFERLSRTLLLLEARRRLAWRLPRGGVERGENSRDDALMIALQHRESGSIVAVAELSEQPKDGKVPGDVRLPTLPWNSEPKRVSYICNLAVLKAWRGQGLGTTLLRSCENVAQQRWGFGEIYLHATTSQDELLGMYKRQGYEALPSFDQPGWVLAVAGREATRYHRKPL